MNTDVTRVTKMGATLTIALPQGWTPRKVATALAREWLEPYRPEGVVKSGRWTARWIVQPVVEEPANGQPLWEEGISTTEYENRLERPDLAWSVQARAGRTPGKVLARLTMDPNSPMTCNMVCSQESLPETLIDPDKLAAFLEAHGLTGVAGLFVGLLLDHGFRVDASNELPLD